MSLNLGSLGMEDASFNFGGSYIMALDCGTTSVLATIVDEYGCIVAQARRSVKTSFPRPGWVEQDPTEVLASQIGVMMEVQFKSGIHSDRIAAIGISNQRETTVVWDRISGQPIYNAIVWQCRRTAPLIDELVEQGDLPAARAIQYKADRIIYKMCEAHGNLYAVQKEILRRMYGLELGGVRAPLPNLIPEDEAVVAEAQRMIEAAVAEL